MCDECDDEPWAPPSPDTALVSLKEQWADIAADRLKEIEQLKAELNEARVKYYRVDDVLETIRRLIDDD